MQSSATDSLASSCSSSRMIYPDAQLLPQVRWLDCRTANELSHRETDLSPAMIISTGRFGLLTVKVTITGVLVPGVKVGIFTIAFIELTTVNDCNPVPLLLGSTVIVPELLVTRNSVMPPGKRSPSVTVIIGVQTLPPGVGVGVGVAVGVGVGVGVGIGAPGLHFLGGDGKQRAGRKFDCSKAFYRSRTACFGKLRKPENLARRTKSAHFVDAIPLK